MFSRFNYKPEEYFRNYIKGCYYSGKSLYDEQQKKISYNLEDFLLKNGHIDGTALKNNWFKGVEANVFLSHSHQDEYDVIAFAGWLYEKFGLKVFIDSCVWGYCDELLQEIDNKYCKINGTESYYYSSRNITTSHVHTMLAASLSEMLDQTECLIFFNTPNSIVLENDVKDRTYSQWLYYELSMAHLIKTTVPQRRKRGSIFESAGHLNFVFAERRDSVTIEYDVGKLLNNLVELKDSDLSRWSLGHREEDKGGYSLDELYKICSPLKKS